MASVLQMSHMLLCHGGVLKSGAMNRQQQVATYWSAMVHDHEHGGLNNDFLIKSRHPLAITYNDQSPLENHHVASASRLLIQPEYQYIPVSLCPSTCMFWNACICPSSMCCMLLHCKKRLAQHTSHQSLLCLTCFVSCTHKTSLFCFVDW